MAEATQVQSIHHPGSSAGRRFVIGLLMVTGVLLHAGFFWVLTIPIPEPLRPAGTEAGIVVLDAGPSALGQLVSDQATLLDSAPLFLPTRWNFASRIDRPAAFAETSPLFGGDPAQVLWSPGALVAGLGETDPVEQPTELLAARLWPVPTAGLGTRDRPRQALPARIAQVRIRSLETGALSERPVMPDEAPASLRSLPDSLWSPATFLLTVPAAGSRIPPLLVSSTRSDAVDAALRRWLGSGDALPDLPAGSYEIVIGP
ncbi:MAG: hypothetical protein ACFE0O_09770 [Opitutales bacterium]